MKLKKAMVDGRAFEVDVDDDGLFGTLLDGDRVTAPTLKALTEKLVKEVRTHGRVCVPATRLEDGWRNEEIELHDIELIGVHAGNNNPLYRVVGSKTTEQLRSYSDDILRRLTAEEKIEVMRLKAEIIAAQKAYDAFKDDRKIHPRTVIEDAQALVIDKAPVAGAKR